MVYFHLHFSTFFWFKIHIYSVLNLFIHFFCYSIWMLFLLGLRDSVSPTVSLWHFQNPRYFANCDLILPCCLYLVLFKASLPVLSIKAICPFPWLTISLTESHFSFHPRSAFRTNRLGDRFLLRDWLSRRLPQLRHLRLTFNLYLYGHSLCLAAHCFPSIGTMLHSLS